MNRLYTILILVMFMLIFSQFVVVSSTDRTEQPKYEVLKSYKGFEVRSYPSLILASTTLGTDSYSEGSSAGFRRVAGYIFGQNSSSEKIAMTSPVIMAMNDSIQMSFIMPEQYDVSNLPQPNDNRVHIHEDGAKKLAVISFKGWASDAKIKMKTEELRTMMDKEGLNYSDEVFYMGYNPPYQVINRRNEIAIVVL